MKLYLKNVVFLYVFSLYQSMPVYAVSQHSHIDGYWLIGSFLASLIGLIILVSVQHR